MIEFFVAGTPRPKGSKRALLPKGHTRPLVVESGGDKLAAWMQAVHAVAQAKQPEAPLEGALVVTLAFRMQRPKVHYRSNGELKDWAPRYHTGTPDIDKLARAVLDALEGPFFSNDAQVAELRASKLYVSPNSGPTGVRITITTIDEALSDA